MNRPLIVASVAALSVAPAATAAVVPAFTENFGTNNANWTQNNSTPAAYTPTGSPAGNGFISAAFTLPITTGSTPVIARATGSANASGGAFIGNFGNVQTVSLLFMHTHTSALPVGVRLGNFLPPATSLGMVTNIINVQPNVWTPLTFDISIANILSFEGTPGATPEAKYNTVLSNVANLQIYLNLGDTGYSAPSAPTPVTFSLDAVSVPEPTSAALAFLGLPLLARRRRR